MNDLFLQFLNMSIAATWAVLAVLLLRLALRKAPKRIFCLLWAIPALRLLIPAFFESDLSLVPSPQVIPADIVGAETPIIYSGISGVDATVNPVLTQNPGLIDRFLHIAAILWLCGMGILLLYSIISWLYLRFTVRVSLEHSAGIYLCDEVKSPFILGIFRPRIYLPSGIDRETMTHVLAHENAHLKRLDHLWKPLGYLLLSIHWFNPVLWVAYILLCRDIERACDEMVLSNTDDTARVGYARALVDCSVHRRMILTCPVAFGEVGVKSRIRAVLSYKKPTLWIILVAFVAGVVTSLCFLTNPRPCTHRYQGQITLAATCTQKGNETFTCADCGHTYMSMTELCPHRYELPQVLTPSDCANHGREQLTCADCGFILIQPLPLAANVHDLQTATVKEPLCGTPGQSKTACTRCSYTEYHDLPALEHQYELVSQQKPTCAHRGLAVYQCTLCRRSYEKKLSRTDKHTWGTGPYAGYCTTCNCIKPGYFDDDWINDIFSPPKTGLPTFPTIRIWP